MKSLTHAEMEFFKESQDQDGISFAVSVGAANLIGNARMELPGKCQAVIAGGFPRDCLLRDGEWSDVDIFVFPKWDNKRQTLFSPLSQMLVNHPDLVLGLVRLETKATGKISHVIYLYVRGENPTSTIYNTKEFPLVPCVKLGALSGGSDGFPLSFRGVPAGPIANLNIMLRDETSLVEIVHSFPVNLSKTYIQLFPTSGVIHTTTDFDKGVMDECLIVNRPAGMGKDDEKRLGQYVSKISLKFPFYSIKINDDVCPF